MNDIIQLTKSFGLYLALNNIHSLLYLASNNIRGFEDTTTAEWAGAPPPLPSYDVTFIPPTTCDSSDNTFDFRSMLLQLLSALYECFWADEINWYTR